MSSSEEQLRRGLTPTASLAVVVGTVIGTGIFLKSALMAQLLGSSVWLLAAWTAAGLLSVAGALTYAELGAMLPHSGGPYVYLKAAYGRLPAFLFGWKELLATKGASNAAVSVGIAIFLTALIPIHAVWAHKSFHFLGETVNWQFGSQQIEAITLIAVLSLVNSLGIAAGGWTQTIVTFLKLAGIVFLVAGVFFLGHQGSWSNLFAHEAPTRPQFPGIAAFGAAMIAALWAYSGWGDIAIAAGEVHKPGQNVPRALIGGILIVMAVYIVANIAYVYALPIAQIATSNSTGFPDAAPVAVKVAESFLGPVGASFITLLFVISALGTLNGGILAGSRIPFAMASDKQFPQALAAVNPKTRTPITAITLLGIWAALLTLTGTFDQITTLVIFVDIAIDFFAASSIFVLRRTLAESLRPYRTPGYPFIPIVYVVTLGWLIVNTISTNPLEVLEGAAILVLGLPVYWYYRGRNRFLPTASA